MNKEVEEIVNKFDPVLTEFIEKLKPYGVLDGYSQTLQMYCGGITVYFGSKEIDRMKVKTRKYNRLQEAIEGIIYE